MTGRVVHRIIVPKEGFQDQKFGSNKTKKKKGVWVREKECLKFNKIQHYNRE
jgi:hypothetical protein